MTPALLRLQPSSPTPLYQQIVEQVGALVLGGRLQPDSFVPSVRDVAAAHGINPMTVSKAYGLLEAEGVLVRDLGKGMRVAPLHAAARAQARALEQLDPLLIRLRAQARALNVPLDDVANRLTHLSDH